jgi:sodium transport system permease protein
MIERIGIVMRKELTDAFRDRKAIFSLLFYPLLGPLLILLLFMVLGQTRTTQTAQRLELPVVGAERAPELIAFLQQQNVTVEPAPTEPEAAVRAGDESVVLVIGEEFQQAYATSQPADIRLIVDTSRQSNIVLVERVRDLLDVFNEQTAAARLQERGLDPRIVEPLAVQDVDVATAQSRASLFLNLAPYFIIFALFLGGSGLAIDTTVGERERKSLEPLLLNPVPRWQLVLGKMAATLVTTVIVVAETLLAFALVLNLVPIGQAFGMQVSLPLMSLALIFLITVPMMLLAVSLQMIIAAFSNSFKEAQNYLMFLPLIPALPGMFLAFVPFKPELWTMLVPTFGQQLLMNQLIRGEVIDVTNVLVSTLVTLVVGAALTMVVLRLYNRERVLFGR